jgi:hypothetical protein
MMHNVSFSSSLEMLPRSLAPALALGLTGVPGSGCLTKTSVVLLHVLGFGFNGFRYAALSHRAQSVRGSEFPRSPGTLHIID